MKNKVPSCVINVMLSTTTVRHTILCNIAKTVHMEIVMCLILYSNKNFYYHFHQKTSNIVHLVEIVLSDIFLTSFAVCLKKA